MKFIVHSIKSYKVGGKMNISGIEIFQGNKIEILEAAIKNVNHQLELLWKIAFENAIFKITFYNVSRLRLGEWSAPVEVHGFEMINHSQNGWEKDSTYEIRDFEDDRVHFFCERYKIEECVGK